MNFMFVNENSFNQNISNWNVSNVKHMYYMFYNTPIPFHKLKITSFFDEPYKTMEPLKKNKYLIYYFIGIEEKIILCF